MNTPMLSWDSAIANYTAKMCRRNAYRLPRYEHEDLMQEARIVFHVVTTRNTREEVCEFAKIDLDSPKADDAIRRTLMSRYKLSLMNRINTMADYKRNRADKATDWIGEDVEGLGNPRTSVTAAMDTALDLKRSLGADFVEQVADRKFAKRVRAELRGRLAVAV